MFEVQEDKKWGLPANADPFFQKYLDVFDGVRVLGDPIKSYLDKSALSEMKDPRITVRVLPPNTTPKDFKNDAIIKRTLQEEIETAEALLIKPTTRKGMMAIKIAKKLHKPYMIEMTGDIHNALKLHPSLLKRTYSPFLYWRIRRTMADCEYGIYVTQDYLQSKYPIKGKMCGCSDVIIESSNSDTLDKRLKKIESMDVNSRVDIALIGFYQGKMKGIDTAIRALSQLPSTFHLNILGNGTKENRDKWVAYGNEYGVYDRIHFPRPLASSHEVLKWIDEQDFFVLPTLSEGLCRCVVEALSRGCVCFTTNVCSMPELLQNECMHSVADDKTLALLLNKYSTNKDLMIATAKRNFEKSKEYNYDVLKDRRNAFLADFKQYCINSK